VGHPVDVATGTLFDQYIDYGLPGLIPLAFSRYYSTALIAKGPGPLGWGFRHNYQYELRQSLEGWVYIDDEGSEVTLTDDGSFAQSGKLTLPAHGIELRGTIDRVQLVNYDDDPSLSFVFVRRPNSRQYDLASMQRHPKNRLDLSYDNQYRLQAVTQSRSGFRLKLIYDAANRVANVICEAGAHEIVVSFAYDAGGDLVTVSDRQGVEAQLQYDAHRMTSESRRSAGVHEFLFDSQGRCVRAAGPDGYETRLLAYDPDARKTVVTDSKGEKTTYEYNDGGQITKVTDPLGNKISYAYDDAGRPTNEVDANGVAVNKEYDDLGRLTTTRFADGKLFEMEWTEDHRLKAAKDPYGLVWKYTYDDIGLLVQTENPRGDIYQYAYTDYGEVESVVTPTGATYRYQHNGAGHTTACIDPLGYVTSAQFDARGNPLEVHAPTGAVTRFTYDAFERVVEVRDSLNQIFRQEYDAQGRLSREYGAAGDYVEYHYNTCGQVVAIRREDGVVERAEFDSEPGRILSVQDGNGNTLSYQYDVLGRPIERRNFDGSVIRFEYDPVGNVTAVVSADGTRQEYEYDAFDQVVVRRTGSKEVKFEYDLNGNMTAALAPDHEVRWERDLYGDVLAETQDNHRIEYQYGGTGLRTEMKTPLGQSVSYQWDVASQLQQLTFGNASIGFEYDPAGQELERHFSGGGRFSRRYDLKGRLVHEAFTPPGLGPAGRGSAQASIGKAPTGFSRDYSYDHREHLQQVRDSLRGTTDVYHDQVGQLRAAIRIWGLAEYFDYDGAGNRIATARLSAAVPPTPDQAFLTGFGPASMKRDELTSRGATVDLAAIGPGNRVSAAQTQSGVCEYDSNSSGFVIEKRVWRDGVKEVWKYEWDDDGRLASVVRPDGVVWQYEYDPMGRRVLKRGPTSVTRYVWDHDRILHALEDGKAPITYVHSPQSPELLICHFGAETNFVVSDLVASPSEYVRPDGVATWWRLNETWGKAFAPLEGQPGFNGQWLDSESGLHYNHFRYYDPDLGRYLSPDPIGLVGGINEYGYGPCPFEGYDPDGLINALGGGPFNYPYPTSRNPDLHENRRISDPRSSSNPNSYGTRTVPGRTENSPGKCLAVLRGPNGQQAFVSGHGRGQLRGRSRTPHTTGGPRGNWNHAEIQALRFLGRPGTPQGHYTLFIDRPFCGRCRRSVPKLLARLPPGVEVTIKIQRADGTFETVVRRNQEVPHGRGAHC